MPRLALALVVAFAACAQAAFADCRGHRGDRVVLYSTTDDPSVLVWDSRARLRAYHAATFDAAQAMLPHAILVGPGTHATVVTCVSNYVESPIFHHPDDAVGVLLSGSQRGITRWVLGSDARLVPARRP
jgi:hypothetical protein